MGVLRRLPCLTLSLVHTLSSRDLRICHRPVMTFGRASVTLRGPDCGSLCSSVVTSPLLSGSIKGSPRLYNRLRVCFYMYTFATLCNMALVHEVPWIAPCPLDCRTGTFFRAGGSQGCELQEMEPMSVHFRVRRHSLFTSVGHYENRQA